jgi:hypothetical protein
VEGWNYIINYVIKYVIITTVDGVLHQQHGGVLSHTSVARRCETETLHRIKKGSESIA